MTPPGVLLALGALALISHPSSYVAGYTISYYDCHDIDQLTTYNAAHTCKDQTLTEDKPRLYAILQKISKKIISGYSCKVTKSRFTDYCGAYGHSKHIETPEIELSYPVSPMDCMDMITTETFTSPQGLMRKVTIGAENIITIEELGTINIGDDTVTCHGQSKRIGNHVINDVLQIAQWKITMKEERFRVSKDLIETSDHLRLPPACNVNLFGCKLHDITYVWQPPKRGCLMEAVQTVMMSQENNFLRSSNSNILLKMGPRVPSLDGCPTTAVYSTEYNNIFLTQPGDHWPEMTDDSSSDLDFNVYVKSRDDYIMYEMEREISHLNSRTKEAICQKTLYQNGIMKLTSEDNVFYKRNGDTVDRFVCAKKTGQLATSLDICYEDIPLADQGFIKPDTRVYTSHSAPKPCNPHYGLKVYTDEKVWVELNPKARKMTEPKELPTTLHSFDHHDLSKGGLYTPTELEAWKMHIELGDMHDAITKTITYGICVQNGDCNNSPGIPQSNLVFNMNELPMVNSAFGFFTMINNAIQTSGAYLAALVLIIELVKFLNFMAAITITIAKDGIDGCKALLYLLCCQPHNMADRVNRRHHRLNLKRKRCESDEETEHIGLRSMETTETKEPDL